MTGVGRCRRRREIEVVIYLEKVLTYSHRILLRSSRRLYNLTGYDITIYFRSGVLDGRRAAENAASDGYGSSFSTTV